MKQATLRAGQESMKLGTSKELFSYWSRLRGERAAPDRADIDPAAIRNVLADTFILELDDDRPFRVSGARIGAIFGRELKGESFLSIWREEDRAAVERMVSRASGEVRPALAVASAGPRGRVRVELEILLLPLRHYGRTQARMLGALSPDAIPTWLGLIAAEPMSLLESRFVRDDEEIQRVEPGAEQQLGLRWPAREEPLRRRHLFVHEGGQLGRDARTKGSEVYRGK
jgi:hypothetical protein